MRSPIPSLFLILSISFCPQVVSAQEESAGDLDGRAQRAYVCCRRLRGFFGWISFQKHCFLLVTADLEERGQVFGLHKRRSGGLPEENALSDTVKNRGSCTLVEDSRDEPEQVQELVKLARLLQKDPDNPGCRACGSRYRLFGRNSNTYVSDLLREAGFRPPRRWCAPGYRRK